MGCLKLWTSGARELVQQASILACSQWFGVYQNVTSFIVTHFLPQYGENVCYSAQQLSCAILLLPVIFREKPQNWFAINEVITVIIFLYLYYLYLFQCSDIDVGWQEGHPPCKYCWMNVQRLWTLLWDDWLTQIYPKNGWWKALKCVCVCIIMPTPIGEGHYALLLSVRLSVRLSLCL